MIIHFTIVRTPVRLLQDAVGSIDKGMKQKTQLRDLPYPIPYLTSAVCTPARTAKLWLMPLVVTKSSNEPEITG